MPEGPGVGTYAKRAEGNTPEGADPFFFFLPSVITGCCVDG